MVPPSGRFRSVRRRSRSPPGLSSRSYPSTRHDPRHLKHNSGASDVRSKFRDQPTFSSRRDFAQLRNSIIQDERGPNLNGSYMSRNRGSGSDRPNFDSIERRPPAVTGPSRRFNRSNSPPPSMNGYRNFNGGRGSIREHRRENAGDRERRFQERGDQQPYRNEPRHHFDNNQTMRDAPRGIRPPFERDHWRSADVVHRRSPTRHKPPRISNLTPRYDRQYLDDIRLRGGHRGGRPFRSGRAAFRSPNRSLPSRR